MVNEAVTVGGRCLQVADGLVGVAVTGGESEGSSHKWHVGEH